MSLCSRLAIAAAVGVLAASAATPAVAIGDRGNDPGNGSHAYGDTDGYGDDGMTGGPGRTNGETGGDDAHSHGDDDSYGNSTTGATGTASDAVAGAATAPQTLGAGAADDDGRRQEALQSSYYKGVVTASTLILRSAPNRGGQIIRYAHKGDIVNIYCKTGGETIDGNPLWYLLPDGTWAWGSARYISNIGPAPRWC